MGGCCSKMTRSPTDQMDMSIVETSVFDMHCQTGRFHDQEEADDFWLAPGDDALKAMLFRRIREVLSGNLDYECDLSGSVGQIREPSAEEHTYYRSILRGEKHLSAEVVAELLHALDGGTVEGECL